MVVETVEFTDLETKSAAEIIQWAGKKFPGKIAFASSFGAEDVVVIDLIAKFSPGIRIITLDTGRLPQETYEVIEKIREKYQLPIEVYFPDWQEVEKMVSHYGPNLFYKSVELRKLCCRVRKIDPLKRALQGLDAWITGLRREQAVTRTEIKKIESEQQTTNNKLRSIIKINPLADWTEKEVWDYIRKNDVPYNKLHDLNYPSIGCAPCTRTVKPGEDIRAGRWWWETPESKECGLHKK